MLMGGCAALVPHTGILDVRLASRTRSHRRVVHAYRIHQITRALYYDDAHTSLVHRQQWWTTRTLPQ